MMSKALQRWKSYQLKGDVAVSIVEKVTGKSMAEKIYILGQVDRGSQGEKEEQGISKIPPL